nr:hypothetical protein DA06_11245 [Georgenia sp. SUBG003]
MLGTETAHEILLRGAGHAGNLSAVGPGDLHGIAADAARRARDENMLARPDVTDVDHALERRGGGDRDDGGLLEREVLWFEGELALLGHGELRETPPADAVHLVPHRETAHAAPEADDGAGKLGAEDRVLRPAEPEREPTEVRLAGHHVPCAAVEARGVDAHEHLAVARRRPWHRRHPHDVRGAVLLPHRRTHRGGLGPPRASGVGEVLLSGHLRAPRVLSGKPHRLPYLVRDGTLTKYGRLETWSSIHEPDERRRRRAGSVEP